MALTLSFGQTLSLNASDLDNISGAIYYGIKSPTTFIETTEYLSIPQTHLLTYTALTPGNADEVYSVRNIYICNNNITDVDITIKVNSNIILLQTIPAKTTWQLIGAKPDTPQGIDHITEVNDVNIKYVYFWGDAGETLLLGTITFNI